MRVANLLLSNAMALEREKGTWMLIDGLALLQHKLELDEDVLLGERRATTEDRRLQYVIRSTAYLCWQKAKERGIRVPNSDSIFAAKPQELRAQLDELLGLIGEKLVLIKLRKRVKNPVDPLFITQLGHLTRALPHVVDALCDYDVELSMHSLASALITMQLPPVLIIKLITKVLEVQ